ncbi:MAG: glycosyltransferase, partial [Bacteroidia bacterium]|nr:glycosyltransferase [Bacteroidia bacterium]
LEKCRKLVATHPVLRVIRLKRNFGQTAATSAGFNHAQGQFIVTLDGDTIRQGIYSRDEFRYLPNLLFD